MIRAVVDTNVFVSGIYWKGPPYRILQAWSQNKFKLIISPALINEYERVVQELNSKYDSKISERIIDLVRIYGELVNPIRFAKPVCRDKNDDMFLAAALSGHAEFVVSGDKDLLVLDGFKGLKIITPKKFTEILECT